MTGCPTWRTPELDEAAAHALAVVTLLVAGTTADDALASELLDQIVAQPDGVAAVVGGLVTICSSLLVLLEHDTGALAEVSLHRLGRLVAHATLSPQG